MDIQALLGTLVSSDSVDNISAATNVPAGEVQSILGSALPSLLNGALAQSESSETAEGFAGALNQHSVADTSDLKGFLGGVDLVDGAKIVGHLLGANSSSVISGAAQQSGASTQNTSNVLSAAAPLIMSLLGQETQTQQQQNNGLGVASIMGSLLGQADMGSILMGLLGAGTQSAQQAQPQPELQQLTQEEDKKTGLLGSLLGDLFGGK